MQLSIILKTERDFIYYNLFLLPRKVELNIYEEMPSHWETTDRKRLYSNQESNPYFKNVCFSGIVLFGKEMVNGKAGIRDFHPAKSPRLERLYGAERYNKAIRFMYNIIATPFVPGYIGGERLSFLFYPFTAFNAKQHPLAKKKYSCRGPLRQTQSLICVHF